MRPSLARAIRRPLIPPRVEKHALAALAVVPGWATPAGAAVGGQASPKSIPLRWPRSISSCWVLRTSPPGVSHVSVHVSDLPATNGFGPSKERLKS